MGRTLQLTRSTVNISNFVEDILLEILSLGFGRVCFE